MAALAALRGQIVNLLLEKAIPFPAVPEPEAFRIDDSMFVIPPAKPAGVAVMRGPNIGEPPHNAPLPLKLAGVAAMQGGRQDHDRPHHARGRAAQVPVRYNIPAYSQYVFEPVDPGFAKRAAQNRDNRLHNFIIAGESYGQGSSREHAAICPMFLGVKAVVAKSIERIHMANLINFGTLLLHVLRTRRTTTASPSGTSWRSPTCPGR